MNLRQLLILVVAAAACNSGTRGGGVGSGGEDGENGGNQPGAVKQPLAAGMRISEISVYQGVKSTFMKDGVSVQAREVPVVEGRDALIRVFVTPEADWQAREVMFRFELASAGGSTSLDATQLVSGPSVEGDLTTTINFEVPGEKITADLAVSVAAYEVDPNVQIEGNTDAARYPIEGTQPLMTESSGDALKVVIIPVRYDADGSGRMPDISDENIARMRDEMFRLYPARKVELTVGDPLPWSKTIQANGRGWQNLLQAIISKRMSDAVPTNVYYYGVFTPVESLTQFCAQGCVAGLSPTSSDPTDEWARGSIGLGYGGQLGGTNTAQTFVHEVGHAHGREHAPCQLGGQPSDPGFPYAGGKIGVWGYDLIKKTLVDPEGRTRDMMGYCQPIWVSDYTYSALFERVQFLNMRAQSFVAEEAGDWQILIVDDEGVHRGDVVSLGRLPRGTQRTVETVDARGAVTGTVTGRYYPFNHLPGGFLLVPQAQAAGTLRVDGRLVH